MTSSPEHDGRLNVVLKIVVFPYDRNPYQDLLYGAVQEVAGAKVKIRYARLLPYLGAVHIPLVLAWRRLLGYKIVHVHWLAFYMNLRFRWSPEVFLWMARANLRWIRCLGYSVVWTVHDIVPHDPETADDLAVSSIMAGMSSKIVHSVRTIEEMRALGLETEPVTVIPHGNYSNIYRPKADRSSARSELGVKSGEVVILYFGIVKEYKGVDLLLDALDALAVPNVRLIVAGKCDDAQILSQLTCARPKVRVDVHNRFVPDDEVSKYFSAADLVCLPFRSVTYSGSAILAMSFGKPVVLPRIGALLDIPEDAAIFYEPSDPNALSDTLRRVIKDPTLYASVILRGQNYIDGLDWMAIAKKTLGVYDSLV